VARGSARDEHPSTSRRPFLSRLGGLALSCGIGMAIAAVLVPGSSMSADDPKTPRFLAAPTADTVFFQGQVDIVGGEGKVVQCKDDGTYWRCFEVKNAGRSN
jgi:hypothetical protein